MPKKMRLPVFYSIAYIIFLVAYFVLIPYSTSMFIKIMAGVLLAINAPLIVYVFIQRAKSDYEDNSKSPK